MKRLFRWYFKTSLILRIVINLAVGAVIGVGLWMASESSAQFDSYKIISYISPFGNIFVYMLKMIVIPVIFFSILIGAASLPIKKMGSVGLKTIFWYFLTSVLAAVLGAALAIMINPGAETELTDWQEMAGQLSNQTQEIGTKGETAGTFTSLLYSMFQNPFKALSQSNFLPIIVFTILFGLAIRVVMENSRNDESIRRLDVLLDIVKACRDAMFKLVDWVLEYSPIGVLALTITNFGLYGPKIVGPYVSVTLGVVGGIIIMVFVVYPLLMFAVTRHNPFVVLKRIQEAMIMAFVTRSSAATLPVSLKVADEELHIHNELSSFSLPLGATINMDGVCVHLPMFAVLAGNMFGMDITFPGLAILVITTVLASIGAGGVPGGSLMLLFIILEMMGLNSTQTSVIVALALGINPILDMFETMNNITGDLVCTYTVANNENLINKT
ncbi:MAG: dicarboxylate/amino acid:cation symporter [Sedimentisphaerales bacterium]|nr:dicarboxylate/amino acid:cation symporter [Sedimentisphaerales bacterium]